MLQLLFQRPIFWSLTLIIPTRAVFNPGFSIARSRLWSAIFISKLHATAFTNFKARRKTILAPGRGFVLEATYAAKIIEH